MKILLDECLPKYLKHALTGHDVHTVQEAGWSGRKNGELLTCAESNFECFFTSDQNLRYQRKLQGRIIAVVELPTNTLSAVKLLLPEMMSALAAIRPGDYVQLRNPTAS